MTPAQALTASYAALTTLVAGLDEDASWVATGCRGWVVRDLVHHLHADCVRALVAVHSPADRPADCDRVSYWERWGSDAATDDSILRGTRTEASPYSWEALRRRHGEAAGAAVRAVGDADPSLVVETQGHAMSVADLTSTLVVEATLHHLDLVRYLPDAGAPTRDGLTETRQVAETLLGRELAGWSDERVALVATGRAPASAQELDELGGAPVPVFT